MLTQKIDEEVAMRASVERDVKLLQTAWELQWSQVKIQKKLAEGGGGVVYQGTFQNMNVAVKKIFRTKGTDLMNQSEVKWMQRARHARLLTFFGCGRVPDTGDIFVVIEFMTEGILMCLISQENPSNILIITHTHTQVICYIASKAENKIVSRCRGKFELVCFLMLR